MHTCRAYTLEIHAHPCEHEQGKEASAGPDSVDGFKWKLTPQLSIEYYEYPIKQKVLT